MNEAVFVARPFSHEETNACMSPPAAMARKRVYCAWGCFQKTRSEAIRPGCRPDGFIAQAFTG
ncbi:hypothetical protein ACVWZ4_002286 [Bradyrhizobium sp. USDA 4472]